MVNWRDPTTAPLGEPVICKGYDVWSSVHPGVLPREWIVDAKVWTHCDRTTKKTHALRSNEGYDYTVGFIVTGWIPIPK